MNLKLDYEIQIVENLKNLNLNLDTKAVLLTDERVYKIYKNIIDKIEAKKLNLIIIEGGEECKSGATMLEILEKMIAFNLNRHSVLLAFGGGVISDIGGLCAALFNRGIEFINIPTTLLAMVDASIGGKCAVNSSARISGKNLIGVFKNPKKVIICPQFVSTQASRDLNCGIVEAIKMAILFDRDFVNFFLENLIYEIKEEGIKINFEALDFMIKRSLELKASVVLEDFKEANNRALLNYGHTFGHCIEILSDYAISHGEAVSSGILLVRSFCDYLGIPSVGFPLLEALFSPYGICYDHRELLKRSSALDILLLDKKSTDEGVNFVFCSDVGHPYIKNIAPLKIKEFLQSL